MAAGADSPSPASARASTWLERIIQVLLGVALVQPLVMYSDAIVAPHREGYRTLLFGLVVVFYVAMSSWIALSTLVSEVPYNPTIRSGKIRFYADVVAVVLYAYLLVSLKPLYADASGDPEAVLTGHLVGYPLVLTAYSIASFARRDQIVQEGEEGNPSVRRRPQPFLALYGAVALAFVVLLYAMFRDDALVLRHRALFNQAALLAILLVVLSYRSIWTHLALRHQSR